MYKFAILDPRSTPEAKATNNKIFTSDPVWGIEVSVPGLAERCIENIDPQHSMGNVNLAAIEEVWQMPEDELPPLGVMLATVRADLDSVGAMALIVIRRKMDWTKILFSTRDRINEVALADKFSRGVWSGPKPLPTRDNPWPEGESAESSQPLAAIAAAVADFKVPLEQRVAFMEEWLLTGKEPGQYRPQVEKERMDLVAALESGQIVVEYRHIWDLPEGWEDVSAPDPSYHIGVIAVVETSHRAATMVGYALAPVVVAKNPKFRFAGGPEHVKFTVCQHEFGHCDLKGALTKLQKLEDGWGGSPTIIGSPQGVGSKLTLDQVTELVGRHLIEK